MLEVVCAEYRKAWAGVYPIELEYTRSEMQPQFANIATPSEIRSNFTLSNGFLKGAGTLTVAGPMSWTGGEVWASRDEGASWGPIARHLPEIYALETAELPGR